jgi:hypothetical protein
VRLHELQALFFRFATDVDGARAAAEATGVEPASFVASGGPLTAEERLDIFSDDYGARILNVLREIYPRTEAHAGEGGFVDVAFLYLQRFQPTSYSLRNLGAELAEVCADPETRDLARLEWLEHDVYDREDAALLAPDDLRAIAPQDWERLRLALIPASARLEHTLVWRKDGEVLTRAIDARERAAIEAIEGGGTFGRVCEAVAEHATTAEAPAVALALLQRWLEDGLLRK